MEDWIIGAVLALFVIIPCWLALARRRETIRQVEAWLELSQRTGLTCTPGYPRSVRGEYRGRSLQLALFTFGDPDHDAPVFQNTSIRLDVQNCARFSLSIQAKSVLDYTDKQMAASSGILDFDRHYKIMGSPRAYMQGVVDLIVQSEPHLLEWMMRKFPSIELTGEHLICEQNSELTNVDDQIALLNLLCDMAELAEKTGRDNVKQSEARTGRKEENE